MTTVDENMVAVVLKLGAPQDGFRGVIDFVALYET